jgi:hypothetical protein
VIRAIRRLGVEPRALADAAAEELLAQGGTPGR